MDEWIGLARRTSNRATAWLAATLLLGLAFLAGQFRAWDQIASARNAFLTTSARHYFNLLTGTHAVHLSFGILALITTRHRSPALPHYRHPPSLRRRHRPLLARHGSPLAHPLHPSGLRPMISPSSLYPLRSTLCIFQGCAQCLDSTNATPPSVQAAFRHAIILLGSAAATLFIATTLLLRRNR